jgi:hypothetical protein
VHAEEATTGATGFVHAEEATTGATGATGDYHRGAGATGATGLVLAEASGVACWHHRCH